jgi:hypothetical protein
VLVVELGNWKVCISQSVRTMEVESIYGRSRFGGSGGANSWKAGRIESFDNCLNVSASQGSGDVSGYSGYRQNFEPRFEKRMAECHCVVDPWIAIDDNLPCHQKIVFGSLRRNKADLQTIGKN